MATVKPGSLTRNSYLDWFDTIQGEATHHGVWKFIDPTTNISPVEPQKPKPSDYKATASKLADLNEDEKIMFREDCAQYRVDIQLYKQECNLIGELRVKIINSLQDSHRKLIFGHMNCRDVLKQIKDRLEPALDLQQLQLIEDYSKLRTVPMKRNIDGWLMEWERFDIVAKRMKIPDFNDYKLIQDFLSNAKLLLPTWVVSKRMEIFKVSNKIELKFLNVLSEFRQFWAMEEFESNANIAAFPASLHGYEQSHIQGEISSHTNKESKKLNYEPGQPRPCNCGEFHRGEECFYLAEGKAPQGFQRDERIIKKFQKACHRIPFRNFIRKAQWTAGWLKDYVNTNWPVSSYQKESPKIPSGSQSSPVIFITSLNHTSLTTNINHPLKNEILLDSGADGHVCNNLGLAASTLQHPTSPSFVQSGSGTSSIVGYGKMVFNAHLGSGETKEIILTNVAFAPDFLTSVVSWKMIKKKGVEWDTSSNRLTFKGDLVCQLLDRLNHDVFTAEPIPDNVRFKEINQTHSTMSRYPHALPDPKLNSLINSSQLKKSHESKHLWHQRLGHPGSEAMKHIRSSAIKIEGNSPKTNECQVCALNKAKKIISRRPSDRCMVPFEKIHFDLVAYTPIGFTVPGTCYILLTT